MRRMCAGNRNLMDMLLSFAVSRGFEFDRATVRCMVSHAIRRMVAANLNGWPSGGCRIRTCAAVKRRVTVGSIRLLWQSTEINGFGKIEVPEVPCRLEIIAYSCGSASGFLLQLDFSHPVVVQ